MPAHKRRSGSRLNWARTTALPPTPASRSDIYYITAAGYDLSANRSTRTIDITMDNSTARTVRTSESASHVVLSAATANAAMQSVSLVFSEPLDANSVDVENFAVLVNGSMVAVAGVRYEALTSTVILTLVEGELSSGDRV